MGKFSISAAVEFTRLLGELLEYASFVGIKVMLTEVQRFMPRQSHLYYSGASQTLASDHLICTAADIDVIENGEVVTDGSHHSYEKLGAYWKELHPGCYHGGDWESKDSRHFGYKPNMGTIVPKKGTEVDNGFYTVPI